MDYNTDSILQPILKEFLATSDIKNKTIKIQTVEDLNNYIDTNGNKPISLLNENKVTEPIQDFFIGIVDTGLDVRIVLSIGVDDGIDISSIDPDATSDSIATYDGYQKGIVYIDPKS